MDNDIKQRLYSISALFVLINIVYFLILELSGATSNIEEMVRFGASRADLVFFNYEYFRLVSSMFMHFDIMHIAGNMIILFLLFI